MTHDHRRRIRALACRASIALCLTATTLAAQPRRPPPKPRPKPPARPTEAPSTAPSAASTIPVTVVELAGTDAYIKPGANGGVHRGAIVSLGGKEYSVTLTTGAFAVIDVSKSPLHEQDTGVASMVSEEEEKPKELVKPRPLATWSQSWTELAPIANEQTPTFVPLGGNNERNRRWDVRLSTAFGGLFPTGGNGPSTIRAELNARIHAEPFDAPLMAPISFDFDASLQRWFGPGIDARDGSAARPVIWLREMLVGYSSGGWYAGLGRMRYAASTLGTLDGTRVQAPLGQGFAIGAFGGVLPDPLSGEPSLVAQRFGVEATFNRPELALRPEAGLVLNGSMFQGSLDERRLSGMFGIYPGLSRFGGHFEVSSFDSNNPWKASPIEVTAAGLDGSVRAGIFQFGGRVDVRQPDRSRWLASFLPAYWFCRTVPSATAATGTEACDGSVSTRALGELDAGVEVGKVSFTIGGTRITDLTQTGGAPDMTGAVASGRVVRIAKIVRIEASGNYSEATYLKMYGGSAGPGLTLFDDALDVSAYYRNATLEYRSVSTSLVQNGFGGTVMLFPSPVVIFTLQTEAITGDDTNALLVFGTMMWRPRL